MDQFGLGWALAGIGLTALVTTVGTWFVTRYQLRHGAETQAAARKEELDRQGTYLAVRVACVLDPFAMEAVDVVIDKGIYDEEGERNPDSLEPRLDLPQDVEWKSIDPHLMDRILSLPNEVASAKNSVFLVGEMISGPPDHDEWFDERWPAAGFVDTEIRCLTELESGNGKKEVQPRVQA